MTREQPLDEAQSLHTSRRILQATIQLYREIGHKKTTVADIARRAAMSPANVYRFFRSKQQIEEAVVAGALGDVFNAAATAADGSASPAYRLEVVIRAIAELHERRLANDLRLHELVAEASEARWPVALAHSNSIVGLLASLIAAG
ncbi:TetR/AcrR family transcriptional regulator, partial [Bradyrhizobium sp.]|uniref:TetR/AcrR family transcriptional regulator n=1 Tax=Bradyrhizobium sp. TaxID=376 RepID=UPI001EBAE949